MDTETLKSFGLDENQIKSVMGAYGKELNPLKQEKVSLEQERDSLKTQVDDVTSQLTEAQGKAEKGSELAKQFEELQQNLKDSEAKAKEQLNATKKSYEVEAALAEVGALNNKAVMALIDTDKVNFDDNGKLIGLSEQLESVKTENDFLFKSDNPGKTGGPKIVNDGNPPAGGSNTTKSLADYSYSELVGLKTSDPTAYQALTGGQE
ncbi:hypothetical protein ESZ50_07990 [Weissella muntiaci]|uniref:Scaffolding protein n=1 Tax=Weissella muntiaci TaxID=2508881 RepID=A0A6C2C581_9LACO|nr:phage scaffolding protein [Weissella muntiaci]TYC48809.1 hypothetical protein ESZ50_07990 [Weissella muntiaci]